MQKPRRGAVGERKARKVVLRDTVRADLGGIDRLDRDCVYLRLKTGRADMKTAIVYYSKHHGNTKKLLDAIAEQAEVTLIDVLNAENTDLSEFDLVGFASGDLFLVLRQASA